MNTNRKIIFINVCISVVVATAVSYVYHVWWYKNLVSEMQKVCDPYGREFGIQPAKDPTTIREVLLPYMAVFRALGDFDPAAPSPPPDQPPKS
jgi:hypothetical protein